MIGIFPEAMLAVRSCRENPTIAARQMPLACLTPILIEDREIYEDEYCQKDHYNGPNSVP